MTYEHRAAVVVLSHRPAMLLESVASAIAQTAPDVQVVAQHSKKLWDDKLNQIVNATDAEFVTILCDDDLLDPRYVAECLRFSEHADLIYTDRIHFQDGTVPADGLDHRMHRAAPRTEYGYGYKMTIDPATFAFGSPLPMTVMVRRSVWDALGGYDGALPHADTEFLYRVIASEARIVYVPQPLFLYRNHDAQLSREATMTPALVAFHRKHFRDFGFMFDRPKKHRDDPSKWDVDVCPPEKREAYIRKHFDPASVAPASPWARLAKAS